MNSVSKFRSPIPIINLNLKKGSTVMVSKKGTRKFVFEGNNFYWFIRANTEGRKIIHILSEDKKVHLKIPFIDSEDIIEPSLIRTYLKQHFKTIITAHPEKK